MPNMANLVSKKFDNTTVVTYTAVQPSAGDGSEAIWQDTTVGNSNATRPTIRFSIQNNGSRTARRAKVRFVGPQNYVETTTGLTKVAGNVVWELTATVPMAVPQQVARDYIASSLQALSVGSGPIAAAISDGQALT